MFILGGVAWVGFVGIQVIGVDGRASVEETAEVVSEIVTSEFDCLGLLLRLDAEFRACFLLGKSADTFVGGVRRSVRILIFVNNISVGLVRVFRAQVISLEVRYDYRNFLCPRGRRLGVR